MVLLPLVLAGCTTVVARSGIPNELIDEAAPYGITSADSPLRLWADVVGESERQRILLRQAQRLRTVSAANEAHSAGGKQAVLALSGGGADGAFGAGLLNGWTARGDRPEFVVVTGISTGAIIAVLAFLGPDYDDALTEVYTTYTTEELLTPTVFSALTGGTAVTDNRGYRRLIEQYIDDEVVERIARESQKGRSLLIGTTNLDASRPVIWNVGAIAETGHPDSRKLIHDIVEASSAIPAVFPPVLIPVETEDGRKFDEMHVDGGATQQVMLFTPSIPISEIDKRVGRTFDRSVFVVVNNKLNKPYTIVRPRVLTIAKHAASSLIGGSGTGDIYKIFAIAQRDNFDLNVVSIPPDFVAEAKEPFDPVYMKSLYQLGYDYGFAGDKWLPHPPDYAPN